MKNIITILLLLFCISVNSQNDQKPLRLTAYSTMYPNDSILWKHIADSLFNKMLYDQFIAIPQSEINLGLHKFGKQHRTGNHLIITGIISTVIGSLIMMEDLSDGPIKDTYPAGVVLTVVGGGLTTAGFIVNIDSFRHIK